MRLDCAENEKTNTINVLMGVFFDGHNSINHNIDYYRNQKGLNEGSKSAIWRNSDETDYSNVARLYGAYKHTINGNAIGEFDYIRRVYVSGFDNVEYDGDRKIASGVKLLKKDIISKVKRGCKSVYRDLGNVIDAASEEYPIGYVNLTLDVYGVGKGAAVARCFANSIDVAHENISEEETSLISYWFEELGYDYLDEEKVNVSVNVRFLGLYDTAVSYGEYGNGIKFNTVLDLGLDGENCTSLIKGVHFCAADEYRSKYSLVTTNSYNDLINQFIFPGTHSDIGGGYKKVVREQLAKSQIFKSSHIEDAQQNVFNEIPNLIKDGWYLESGDSEGKINKNQSREVVNTYSFVFLFLMLSQSMENGYDYILDHNSLKVAKKLIEEDTFMEEVQKRMNEAVSNSPLYKLNGLNKCDLGKTGSEILPCFKEGDSDDKIVRGLRSRYIHLPSTIVLDPETQNIKNRTILKG